MKGQTHIDFRTRRKAASAPSSEITNNKVKIVDTTKAFRPVEIPYEPTKVEKPKPVEKRKSGRIAKNMKQTVLNLKANDKSDTQKRKSDITPVSVTKKQKTLESKVCKTSITLEKHADETDIIQESSVEHSVDNKLIVEEVFVNQDRKEESTEETEEKDISITEEEYVATTESKDESSKTTQVDIFDTVVHEDTLHAVYTPIDSYDSPSPPSLLTEPCTPPVHLEDLSAPYKTCITSSDRARIENEKTTLEKLRKALDIVITDRMARSKPTLYHQVEPVLRNSTRKDVTLSHVCKVMFLAPNLYTLEAKELRDFGGKVTEAFAIEFNKEWTCPLAGKDLQKRSDILKDGLNRYFDTHKEPDATVPEMKLPRLSLVVDKDDWINNAHLPAGIKALLESHKKISEAEEESKKPKPKPVGSVKDRMAALRARLAKKNSS